MIPTLWALTRRYVPILAVFFAIWVVMNERIDWIIAGSGVLVAVVTLVLTNRVLGVDFATIFLSPWSTFRYLLALLRAMVSAAWGMAVIIVAGPPVVTEFQYESGLTDETLLFVLATSITLTPATVSVERDGSTITVITADSDLERARAGCASLEKSISRLLPPPAAIARPERNE